MARVLVVDDEASIRNLLTRVFGQESFEVLTATNGREGLEMFHVAMASESPFQVVITDLGMPEVDGRQVARTIKAKSPQTPVIMMTGWGKMMKENGEKAPEVDAILPKPPSIQGLQELLLRFAPADLAENSIAE